MHYKPPKSTPFLKHVRDCIAPFHISRFIYGFGFGGAYRELQREREIIEVCNLLKECKEVLLKTLDVTKNVSFTQWHVVMLYSFQYMIFHWVHGYSIALNGIFISK